MSARTYVYLFANTTHTHNSKGKSNTPTFRHAYITQNVHMQTDAWTDRHKRVLAYNKNTIKNTKTDIM